MSCEYRLLEMFHGNVVHIFPPALEPLLLILHHLLGKCHVALMDLLTNRRLAPSAFRLHCGKLAHCELDTAEQLVAPVNSTCRQAPFMSPGSKGYTIINNDMMILRIIN
eukprot:GHUV01056531.1.p1 GENE.GHUV01056531.1~~GHUV01056531.1.p1  ORF type:complete len:109 (+),score=12.57 GHUV01056531.1:131-457(+)